MSDPPRHGGVPEEPPRARIIGGKAARKLHAQKHPGQSVWSGLGMMGLVGWSIVVPTLLGAALGGWLDHRYPDSRSWTLVLLVAGLVMGCMNTWRWIAKEENEMHREQGRGDD